MPIYDPHFKLHAMKQPKESVEQDLQILKANLDEEFKFLIGNYLLLHFTSYQAYSRVNI